MPMTLADLAKQGFTISADGKVVQRTAEPKTAARPVKADKPTVQPVPVSSFPWRRLAIYCLACLVATAGCVALANLFAGAIYAVALFLGWLVVNRLRSKQQKRR